VNRRCLSGDGAGAEATTGWGIETLAAEADNTDGGWVIFHICAGCVAAGGFFSGL